MYESWCKTVANEKAQGNMSKRQTTGPWTVNARSWAVTGPLYGNLGCKRALLVDSLAFILLVFLLLWF